MKAATRKALNIALGLVEAEIDAKDAQLSSRFEVTQKMEAQVDVLEAIADTLRELDI